MRVSTGFGSTAVWPGDTFGISALTPTELAVSWGGAVAPNSATSEIFATTVGVTSS